MATYADTAKGDIQKIDDGLKGNGHKGLHKKYGVGRFLYRAMRGEISLEDGVGYAFWTELSDVDKRVDNKWRLSQVIDNYEIYKITEFASGEYITMTIAIPANTKMPMEGQTLKDGFYLFTGNVEFISVAGIPMLIQGFTPITLNHILPK